MAWVCLFTQWFYVTFDGDLEQIKSYSINWREMYEILKALATWGEQFKNTKSDISL